MIGEKRHFKLLELLKCCVDSSLAPCLANKYRDDFSVRKKITKNLNIHKISILGMDGL